MSKTLIEVLEENDVKLEASGPRFKASCPFHKSDETPSFTVYPSGTYFCFGCEVWGDAVKFLVEYKGMTQEAALAYCGIEYKTKKARTMIKVQNTFKMYRFLREVAERYYVALLNQTGAINYLLRRGLTYDTINKYKLGYTGGNVLNLRTVEDMQLGTQAGLVNENGYELLSHRIIIPNLVQTDLCDFMIGRTVVNNNVKYLGIRTPKPIIGLTDVIDSPVIFLAEGQFDYLILRQWGYPAVVMGGTHITKVNRQMLKNRKIVMIPDNDAPGLAAAKSLQESLPNIIILDYASLGVKDIAEAAEKPDGEEKFRQIVGELPWITSLSTATLAKWFPTLSGQMNLPLT